MHTVHRAVGLDLTAPAVASAASIPDLIAAWLPPTRDALRKPALHPTSAPSLTAMGGVGTTIAHNSRKSFGLLVTLDLSEICPSLSMTDHAKLQVHEVRLYAARNTLCALVNSGRRSKNYL